MAFQAKVQQLAQQFLTVTANTSGLGLFAAKRKDEEVDESDHTSEVKQQKQQ